MASTMPKLFHLLILLLVSLLATIFMAARIASQVGASGRVIGRRQLLGGASLVGTTGLIRPMTAAAATPEGLQTAKNGMQWVDVEVGAGDAPVKGAQIKCHYTGRLKSNGQKFDSSYDRRQPLAFTIGVGQVIKGWDVGILGNGDDIPPMRYGGKRLVIIPPELGYGARGAGGVIPPNAVLEFDVELLPRNEATGWLQEQLEKGVAQAKSSRPGWMLCEPELETAMACPNPCHSPQHVTELDLCTAPFPHAGEYSHPGPHQESTRRASCHFED